MTFKDLIKYDKYEWRVREVVHDLRWELEAYYDDYINSRLIRVVFYTDIMSPRATMRKHEFEQIIKKIDDRYNYTKQRYGIKKGI
jgi:hypothetical protein